MPDSFIVQPEKVITPCDSACEHPERVAPLVPVPEVITSVTVEVSEVTGLPLESSTVIVGCVVSGAPCAPPEGWVLNASCEAAPSPAEPWYRVSSTAKLIELVVPSGPVTLKSISWGDVQPAVHAVLNDVPFQYCTDVIVVE